MIQLEPVMSPDEFATKRKHYGLTQNDLALKIGVATIKLQRWEQGHTMIPRWVRPWFRGMFGEPPAQLWGARVENWYGVPGRSRIIPAKFATAEEAAIEAKRQANLTHWGMVIAGPSIVLIETE